MVLLLAYLPVWIRSMYMYLSLYHENMRVRNVTDLQQHWALLPYLDGYEFM